MIVWCILRKLVLIPVIIVLTLIKWCGIFLVDVARTVINVLAVILLIAAGLSALIGIASGMGCWRMVGIALGGVIVGNVLALCTSAVIAVRDRLKELL